jgi:hypothetical protein
LTVDEHVVESEIEQKVLRFRAPKRGWTEWACRME